MKKYLSFHLGKCRCRGLENGHLAIECNIKELYIIEETTPFQVLLPFAEQMKKNRCLCYSTAPNGIFITFNPSGRVLLSPHALRRGVHRHPTATLRRRIIYFDCDISYQNRRSGIFSLSFLQFHVKNGIFLSL